MRILFQLLNCKWHWMKNNCGLKDFLSTRNGDLMLFVDYHN